MRKFVQGRPWWVGKEITCLHCDAAYVLDAEDRPTLMANDLTPTFLIRRVEATFTCPTCGCDMAVVGTKPN